MTRTDLDKSKWMAHQPRQHIEPQGPQKPTRPTILYQPRRPRHESLPLQTARHPYRLFVQMTSPRRVHAPASPLWLAAPCQPPSSPMTV